MKRIILGSIAILAALIFSFAPMVVVLTKTKVYDCRALHGGWHPDVPVEVQKKCRDGK